MMILGGLSSVVTAAPLVTVSFKTSPVGAEWTPQNCVAAWVEAEGGIFIKTIGRWCELRKIHLVAWQNKAGLADVDAVTGATRIDHGLTLTAMWDLKDQLGALVPDGIYTIRMETADGNSTATGQNNQGLFTFTKGLVPEVQTNLMGGGYTEVSIDFNPTAGECNNNIVDPGETCDPPGSCPTECDQSATNACAPNVMIGSSTTCTAACAITAITACISGDGCCAEGCSPAQDDDCTSNEKIEGGCATSGEGNGGLLAFALFGALVLVTRRRR